MPEPLRLTQSFTRRMGRRVSSNALSVQPCWAKSRATGPSIGGRSVTQPVSHAGGLEADGVAAPARLTCSSPNRNAHSATSSPRHGVRGVVVSVPFDPDRTQLPSRSRLSTQPSTRSTLLRSIAESSRSPTQRSWNPDPLGSPTAFSWPAAWPPAIDPSRKQARRMLKSFPQQL